MNPTPETPEALVIPRRESTELSVTSGTQPIAKMLQTVIDRGVTNETVGVLEKMMDLYERMQTKDAEKAFAQAFVELQNEMPSVQAVKAVPDRNGGIKYHFAPYEEIMNTVRPLLLKHGFTVSFSQDYKEGRVIETCTLMHTQGHSKSNVFGVRIGSGPPGASEAQADGAASTYSKRHALCNALNIIIENDTDARKEGPPIAKDKAQYLRELVKETKSDEARFLHFAGTSNYEDISEEKYPRLVASLLKKQEEQRKGGA